MHIKYCVLFKIFGFIKIFKKLSHSWTLIELQGLRNNVPAVHPHPFFFRPDLEFSSCSLVGLYNARVYLIFCCMAKCLYGKM